MSTDNEILEELKEIRKLLTPPPPPPPPKTLFEEFKRFLLEYKVLGLAVAFIMGIYVGAVVQALVDDLIMPIVTIFTPGVDWELLTVGPFRIGHFIGTILTFVIVAVVIFIIVKISKKMGIQ